MCSGPIITLESLGSAGTQSKVSRRNWLRLFRHPAVWWDKNLYNACEKKCVCVCLWREKGRESLWKINKRICNVTNVCSFSTNHFHSWSCDVTYYTFHDVNVTNMKVHRISVEEFTNPVCVYVCVRAFVSACYLSAVIITHLCTASNFFTLLSWLPTFFKDTFPDSKVSFVALRVCARAHVCVLEQNFTETFYIVQNALLQGHTSPSAFFVTASHQLLDQKTSVTENTQWIHVILNLLVSGVCVQKYNIITYCPFIYKQDNRNLTQDSDLWTNIGE